MKEKCLRRYLLERDYVVVHDSSRSLNGMDFKEIIDDLFFQFISQLSLTIVVELGARSGELD